MTYLPKFILPASPTITFLSSESNSNIASNLLSLAVPASGAWPSSNLAIYIPFQLKTSIQVYKLFTVNGATAANNFDIGIYSSDGAKIVSTGSTAESGTSALQVVSITTTTIGPGNFYLAMAVNGTSGTYLRNNSTTVNKLQMSGIYQQASAFALPATATFATPTQTYIPLFGLATTLTV